MPIFEASVQYNDLKGSVAADRADNESLGSYLEGQKLISDDEFVCAFRFGFHGNHGDPVEKPGIVVYVMESGERDAPKSIRPIELDITISEFFKYFKRFDVVATAHGEKWPEDIVQSLY